jgi:LuxR family maltose regulon positive regulatory protein
MADSKLTPREWTRPLTPREIRVLELLADGYDYGAIGSLLFVQTETVKKMMAYRILPKLGADNKTQAVAMALRRGLIQ